MVWNGAQKETIKMVSTLLRHHCPRLKPGENEREFTKPKAKELEEMKRIRVVPGAKAWRERKVNALFDDSAYPND